jgi:chemotaxis protein CheX
MPTATIESALEVADGLTGRLLVDAAEPFVAGAGLVLEQSCHQSFHKGLVQTSRFVSTPGDWNALVAVVGERIAGVVLYSMSELTAVRIAGHMLGGPAEGLGEMELSALDELANMITGQASMQLEKSGFKSQISPPRPLLGAGRYICPRPLLWLEVPLKTGAGTLNVALALRQSAD